MTKKLKIYQYGACSTCQKALKFLKSRDDLALTILDITQTPPQIDELRRMAAKLGSVRKLFNTSGLVYKEMKLSQSLPTLSDDEALALLASNGRLVKRPFLLIDDAAAAVGFKVEEWSALSL